MEDLIISLEREGVLCPVGRIVGNNSSDSCFAYSDSYLKSEDAAPISLSLSLQPEPFSPAQTRNFFEGLLPEGFTRRNLAQWMHVAEGDYLSLLHGLGRECLGAVAAVADACGVGFVAPVTQFRTSPVLGSNPCRIGIGLVRILSVHAGY